MPLDIFFIETVQKQDSKSINYKPKKFGQNKVFQRLKMNKKENIQHQS